MERRRAHEETGGVSFIKKMILEESEDLNEAKEKVKALLEK
jgi:hypothetical protein